MNDESGKASFREIVGNWFARFDLGFLAVAAICLLAVWPFISRQSLPQATDAELHIFRLAELSRLFRAGELFPRWAPNFYFGYGYPIFNYYAPLTYQLGLSFDLMPLLGPVQAVKALFILGIGMSGIGMYGYVRDLWGRGAGLVAAASYVYAPFIIFVDPHARGDLPESFSFGVFILALWALDRLRRSPTSWNWLASVLLVAGLILTHNLMAIVFFTILIFWAVWQLVIKGYQKVPGLNPRWLRNLVSFRVFMALILGLALAAFFWLPVALESDAVNLSSLIGEGGHFDFRNNFLGIGELFGPTKLIDWGATEPDYELNYGSVQLLLGAVGALTLLSKRTRSRRQGLYFLLAFSILFLLMLRQSSPIWEVIPLLQFLQFPWRLLGPSAAMLAVLSGVGASLALQHVSRRYSGWLVAGVVALIIVFAMPLFQVPPWPEEFGATTAGRVLDLERAGRWLGTTSTSDFVPASVEVLPKPEQSIMTSIYANEPPDRVNRATLPAGTSVKSESITPLKSRYIVSGEESFLLRLFLFDFPGWRATVDGQKVDHEIGRPEGFFVVPVPAGDHLVEVNFNNTPPRNAGLVISSISLLATIMLAWRYRKVGAAEDPEQTGGADGQKTPEISVWPVMSLSLLAIALLALNPEQTEFLRYESSGMVALTAENDSSANFGDQITLIGYDLDAEEYEAGDLFELTLYWKAQQPLEINYQVFAHLLDSNGFLIGQSDKLNPGDFPSRRWPEDKYVRDEHKVEIPAVAEPGDYQISVGLWVAADGWRLPLLDEDGRQISDSYILPVTLRIR